MIGYSDADWASDRDDRHSVTGNLFLMGGGSLSWLSKKQATVALLTAEPEYVALSSATQEAVWLRCLFEELGFKSEKSMVVYEDNQGAIAIAKNPVAHSRTKHIEIKYHYIREAVRDGTIEPTEEMLADILTKPLSKGRFAKLCSAIAVEPLHTLHEMPN